MGSNPAPSEQRTEAPSKRMRAIGGPLAGLFQFLSDSPISRRFGQPGMLDFVFGNPHEMPLPGFPDALQRWSQPQREDWFAYKDSTDQAQEIVANTLRQRTGMDYQPEDVLMTSGAFAALAASLGTVLEPEDEVIYISPPWFFYEGIIQSHYAKPVRVHCRPDTFDLDLEAITSAITARTRAIIVNSPNNPTGRIYPPASLRELAALLDQASRRNDRAIYLVSDESYNRIVYDERAYISPAAFYPNTLLVYTYGKTLLTPGQRIGYIALTPAMPGRKELRQAIFLYQYVSGYLFPNALLQHALPDLEKLSIDVSHLQEKRDRFYSALQAQGYQLHKPDGTFYLLVRSPLENDLDFSERLAEKNVLVLPGKLFEMPGYFRISLTGTMEMIEAALPVFKEAISWGDGRG